MHDLVQDMGREIVRKESPREPGKRSRLIDPKDVFEVLQGNKGTKAIEGVIVNSDMLKNVSLSTKVFTRMVNLRILILDDVCLRGSFKYLSNELRLFWLHNCQLSRIQSDFHFEKLVELELKGTNIKEFQPNMQNFRCLKIFNLLGCKQLKKMPDFTGAQSLQELKFHRCPNLVQVHPSIGRLERLVVLDFERCKKLKKTPDFTGAQSLQKLSFRYCLNLVHVHPSIGSLERLVVLDFELCKKLKELPSSICKLKSLEQLRLDYCEKLKELPNDLGKLEQLKELRAWGTAVSHKRALIPSKSKSHFLDILQPHFLSRKTRDLVGFFPPSVANLCSLETLLMPNRMHEVDIPIGVGSLSSLKELNLSGSYLQSLPFSLCHLSNLKRLNLSDSHNLRELLELPPNLEELLAKNCASLEKIADLSNLKRLIMLDIRNCKSLVELPGLESLESLEMLDITSCNALSIRYNDLYEVDLPTVPGSLASLRELDLIGTLCLPLSLCHHSNLRSLWLNGLRNLKALPQLPSTLAYLSTRNCVSLERIADISSLKRLVSLYTGNCKNLVELPGLESSLESLRDIEMRNCSGLSIPLIEKWFQAHCKADSVNISFDIYRGVGDVIDLKCKIPTLFRHGKYIYIHCFDIDVDVYDDVGVSVRSKTTGAWILNNAKYNNIGWMVELEFEVPTMMGQVLEVYADFHAALLKKRVCVFEIHRNSDGEVRFFPSTN